MKRRQLHTRSAVKRRITLTLPADSLRQAERIARARKVNLSTVVSEALAAGLRMHTAPQRTQEILNAYRRAFAAFSNEEIATLDGVLLEPSLN
jgi:post-segregation antitoxin (ccd killing protein)